MENIEKMKRRRTENKVAATVLNNKQVKLKLAQLSKVENDYQNNQVQDDTKGPESSVVNINYDATNTVQLKQEMLQDDQEHRGEWIEIEELEVKEEVFVGPERNDENVLVPPYYCGLCHQYFCSALTLTQHENLQHEVKVCSCEICDKPIPEGSYTEDENNLKTIFNLNIHTKMFRLNVQKNLNTESVNDSSLHRNVNRNIPVNDLNGNLNMNKVSVSTYVNNLNGKNKNHLKVEKELNDIDLKRIVSGVRTYSNPKNKPVNVDELIINTDNFTFNDEEAVLDSAEGSENGREKEVTGERELYAEGNENLDSVMVQPSPDEVNEDPSSTAADSNSLIDRLHYQCEFCEVTYVRWDYMMSHIARVHTSAKPFSCNVCFKQFAKKIYLLDHEQLHKPYACNVCSRTFSSKPSLLRHMQHYCINRKTQETIYTCDRCKKKYNSKISLYNHRRYSCYDKTGEMPFACDYCSYKCPKQYHLNRHMNIRHSLVYTCDVCNRDFKNRSHMQRHLLIHKGIKQFSCEICNKRFRRKERLVEHELRHSNLKPFACKECGKSFFRTEYVVRHNKLYCNEEVFAKKPYMCDVCKRRFENKRLLTKHIVKNHVLVFACNLCEKKFGDKYKLEAHLRRHGKNLRTYSLAKKE